MKTNKVITWRNDDNVELNLDNSLQNLDNKIAQEKSDRIAADNILEAELISKYSEINPPPSRVKQLWTGQSTSVSLPTGSTTNLLGLIVVVGADKHVSYIPNVYNCREITIFAGTGRSLSGAFVDQHHLTLSGSTLNIPYGRRTQWYDNGSIPTTSNLISNFRAIFGIYSK